jgi:hypothetical protein
MFGLANFAHVSVVLHTAARTQNLVGQIPAFKPTAVYTQTISKVGVWATRKLPRLDDRKVSCVNNTAAFKIVQPRGFGALQTSTFEIVWV